MECRYCKSENVIKRGTIKLKNSKEKQIYFCKDCKKRFVAEKEYERVFPIEHKVYVKSERKTYPQDWPNYNEAQKQEKLIFTDLLKELCSFIKDETPPYTGRPAVPIRQMIFACVIKCYERVSSRREYSELKMEQERDKISIVPHFNTVIKYFNDPKLIPILTDLITFSALPLRGVEDTFAVDSSGLSSALYSRWFDYRFNNDRKVRNWLKIHAICGTKTNIITAIKVTAGKAADSPQFPQLVKNTAKFFKVSEVSADKGYSSRYNYEAVAAVGGECYIPFKKNSTGTSRGSVLWHKMYHYFMLNHEEFEAYYHKRSNVESTFSMIKRNLGGRLMMKKEVSQVVESLAKVLCHNILCLIHESFESGIIFDLASCAHLLGSVNTNSTLIKG